MASQNFARALDLVLVHEGGYVDHPKDPGGATNLGITHRTLSAFRGRKVNKDDVRRLTKDEAALIYKQQYWNTIKGNDLPPGVDYAVFDYAVNSGPARAVKDLQKTLGITPDGVLGVHTLDAIKSRDPRELIHAYCERRMDFLRALKTFKTFGKGWTRRVDGVRRDALNMVGVIVPPTDVPDSPDPTPKADPEDRSLTDILTKPEALGPAASVLSALGSILAGSGPLQWAFAALVVGAGGVGLYYLVRRIRREA